MSVIHLYDYAKRKDFSTYLCLTGQTGASFDEAMAMIMAMASSRRRVLLACLFRR